MVLYLLNNILLIPGSDIKILNLSYKSFLPVILLTNNGLIGLIVLQNIFNFFCSVMI